jgi:hypothetical protein
MTRNESEEAVSFLPFISISLGYMNGIKIERFGLLIDRTSPTYLLSQFLWGI